MGGEKEGRKMGGEERRDGDGRGGKDSRGRETGKKRK